MSFFLKIKDHNNMPIDELMDKLELIGKERTYFVEKLAEEPIYNTMDNYKRVARWAICKAKIETEK